MAPAADAVPALGVIVEIEELFGLPAHPLIVHAVVVLLPLAAVAPGMVPAARPVPLAVWLTMPLAAPAIGVSVTASPRNTRTVGPVWTGAAGAEPVGGA